jgi:DNA mismatch endonuclease (patch repair protein)
MSRIKGRDTKPEKIVRSLLHNLGYRFRLQRRDLPGKPDVVLPKYKKAIFVHGCFWHGHKGCQRAARPTSNIEFWDKKIDSNMKRDEASQSALAELGWSCFVVWQCEMRDMPVLTEKLESFLNNKWGKSEDERTR